MSVINATIQENNILQIGARTRILKIPSISQNMSQDFKNI